MSAFSSYFIVPEDEWQQELRLLESDAYEQELEWQRKEREEEGRDTECYFVEDWGEPWHPQEQDTQGDDETDPSLG